MKKLKLITSHLRQKWTYSLLYKIYKDDHRSLHWNKRQSQEERFRIFTQMADLNQQSVADIGCGLAHFYDYLLRQGIDCRYSGYDLVSGFIRTASEKFPDAQFYQQNLTLHPAKQMYDFVFCSGLFAFGNQSFFQEMIARAFDMCEKGLAFNLYQTPSKEFFYLPPQKAQEYCQSLGPRQMVLHDNYLPQDFTLFLYK